MRPVVSSSAVTPSPVMAVRHFHAPLEYLELATPMIPPPILTHLVALSGFLSYTRMPWPGSSYTQPPVVFISLLSISTIFLRISVGSWSSCFCRPSTSPSALVSRSSSLSVTPSRYSLLASSIFLSTLSLCSIDVSVYRRSTSSRVRLPSSEYFFSASSSVVSPLSAYSLRALSSSSLIWSV